MPRMKKEDQFYTMLKDLAQTLSDAADEYVTIFEDYPASESHIPQMKVYENQCDQKVSHILKELYSSFITPFEREDISALAFAMDDIIDNMNAAAMLFDLLSMSDMCKEAPQMARLTKLAVDEVKTMIDHLPNYKTDRLVMEMSIAIGSVEDEGDVIYQNAMRRLFTDEEAGRYTLAWVRMFEIMEKCMDACDHTAGVVRSVVMKSA